MLKVLCDNNKIKNNKFHEENQYLNLLKQIIDNGTWETGRNGRVLSIYGAAMHFSLENNKIPLLTSKKVAWKTCLRELLWFISGNTSNKVLNEKNVHIWDGNSSRDFLDSRKLYHLEENDLGPIYGFQWRHFNANYSNCNDNYENKGIDQLQDVINTLKDPHQRTSRRMIISAWNPCQINEMALPPCHILMQFNVIDNDKLSCSMYQRSNDEACGTPFNILSYSILTHLIAKHCGLKAYEFLYFKGNCHIYEEHLENIKIQMVREPYEFPEIEILNIYDDICKYKECDFKINNYIHHESLIYKMVA